MNAIYIATKGLKRKDKFTVRAISSRAMIVSRLMYNLSLSRSETKLARPSINILPSISLFIILSPPF